MTEAALSTLRLHERDDKRECGEVLRHVEAGDVGSQLSTSILVRGNCLIARYGITTLETYLENGRFRYPSTLACRGLPKRGDVPTYLRRAGAKVAPSRCHDCLVL